MALQDLRVHGSSCNYASTAISLRRMSTTVGSDHRKVDERKLAPVPELGCRCAACSAAEWLSFACPGCAAFL